MCGPFKVLPLLDYSWLNYFPVIIFMTGFISDLKSLYSIKQIDSGGQEINIEIITCCYKSYCRYDSTMSMLLVKNILREADLEWGSLKAWTCFSIWCWSHAYVIKREPSVKVFISRFQLKLDNDTDISFPEL